MEVLNEVERLFKKLETLPDDLKQIAVKRIAEKLPCFDNNVTLCSENKRKRPGRKPGRKSVEGRGGGLYTAESHDSEYVLQSVLTRGGRKAQRYCPSLLKHSSKESSTCRTPSILTPINNKLLDVKKDQEEWQSNDGLGVKKSKSHPEKINRSTKKETLQEMPLQIQNTGLSDTDSNVEDTDSDVKPDSLIEEPQLVIVDSCGEADEDTSDEKAKDVLPSVDPPAVEKDITMQRTKPRKESLEVKQDDDYSDTFSQNYACNHCSYQTSVKTELRFHMRKHKGPQPHTCEECGKFFLHLSGLKVHLKRHRGQRDFPCDYSCDYRAYTRVDLDRHMTVHTGERSQMCQYCGKAFAKDSTLREHVKTIHERPDKHVCSTCGFSTYRANNLRVHISMRHRGEYNNHVCPVCGAKVKQRAAFLDHMRSHTGERPYRCHICKSSFTCLARLTVHRKAVHEPRQFSCKDCMKRFQTKHHLLRHQVIHTNKKPFTCPFCSYACNTQGNVTKHVKTVHNKLDFSYRKYKADLQIDEDCKSVKSEWIEKGEKLTEEYLKDFSKKVGRPVTLAELKEQEAEKNRKINEEVKQLKMKRLSRIRKHEHSYHSSKSTPGEEARLREEEVDEPRAVLLSVPAETSGNKKNNESQECLQQVQVLPEVTLNHLKEVSQTIYIQNTATARNVQTVLPQANVCTRLPTTSVVSTENVEFCVAEPVIYEEQIPLQLIYHSNTTSENSVEESDPKFLNNINFVEMKGSTSDSPTVVVIINTENP